MSKIRNISLHKTSLCGLRASNEDVEKYNMNLSVSGTPIDPNYAPVDFFVVCDGHGGSKVGEFIVPHLEQKLMRKNIVYPLSYRSIVKIYNDIQQMLIDHPDKIAQHCGCTCVVVIRFIDSYHKYNIQVINIGDSRAILSRRKLAIPLCKDHKPIWPDEKRRIDMVSNTTGIKKTVMFNSGDWRIGDLSVSRSFGDLDNTPHVTHIPDSYCYELIPDDEFIVLCCDGVTDVLENHEIVNFITDHYHNNRIEYYDVPGRYSTENISEQKNIARKLAEYSIARGSTDNVSVMIVFFDRK